MQEWSSLQLTSVASAVAAPVKKTRKKDPVLNADRTNGSAANTENGHPMITLNAATPTTVLDFWDSSAADARVIPYIENVLGKKPAGRKDTDSL